MLFLSRALAALAFLTLAFSAQAHEIVPSIATLQLKKDWQFTLKVETNLEAQLAGISAEHEDTDDAPEAQTYNRLRGLAPDALRQEFIAIADEWVAGIGLKFDGVVPSMKLADTAIPAVGDVGQARSSVIELTGSVPPTGKKLTWAFPEVRGGSVLRIERPDQELQAHFFFAGEVSEPIGIALAEPRNWMEKTWDYIVIGFTHILPKGLDHILFVLGLFFLSVKWRPLLLQVTAFTLAHSVTLAMGIYGVVNIAPFIVEPLIALSIVYVAVENIFTRTLHLWRPIIVFAFGLLHGLGFAGVLSEIGLPPSDFVLGLVAFNVGVELGQLTVLLLAFVAVGWLANKPWYRSRIAIPASLLIAAMGAYWFIERTLLA